MIESAHPILQGLYGTLFTWFVTALGSSVVFLLPVNLSPRIEGLVLDASLGFAAGVMLAASFWSLLDPALEMSEHGGWGETYSFAPVAVGFVAGAFFVFASDVLLPEEHGHNEGEVEEMDAGVLSKMDGNGGKADRVFLLSEDQRNRTDENESNEDKVNSLSVLKGQAKRGKNGGGRRTRGNGKDRSSKEDGASGSKNKAKDEAKDESSEDNGTNDPRQGAKVRFKKNGKANGKRTTSPDAMRIKVQSLVMAPADAKDEAKSKRRILLLLVAVVLHNFPEGLAVGVAFGGIGSTKTATFEKARTIAIGIGLQNFPEGLAVALPLRRLGWSRSRAFFFGQLSGLVEPIGGLLGAAAVQFARPVLPYALSFAAGAMVYAVVDSVVPESHARGNSRIASWGCIVGFVIMMALDVALG